MFNATNEFVAFCMPRRGNNDQIRTANSKINSSWAWIELRTIRTVSLFRGVVFGYVIFFITLFCFLGTWQLYRLQWKQNLINEIKKHCDVSIEEVIVAEEKVVFKLPKIVN